MSRSARSALHGVNPNLKKSRSKNLIRFFINIALQPKLNIYLIYFIVNQLS